MFRKMRQPRPSSRRSELLGLDAAQVWDTGRAFRHLNAAGLAGNKRTAERTLHKLALLPRELKPEDLEDGLGRKPIPAVLAFEIKQARVKRKLVLFAQLASLPNGRACLHANDARGARYWIPLAASEPDTQIIEAAMRKLQRHVGKDIAVFPHGPLVGACRKISKADRLGLNLLSCPPVLNLESVPRSSAAARSTPHLKRLEAESIHILREAVAEAERPAMLFSAGKENSVMLQLARKAFYPAQPPFPLLHIDTGWELQEMSLFRDAMARASGMELLVHINSEAVAKDTSPFGHHSAHGADVTKAKAVQQALDTYRFDVVLGGARRDEENARANAHVFSVHSKTQLREPISQRPELWNICNARTSPGESIHVLPLSNWTEIDVWQYIHEEDIPVVPLYFAKLCPVVARDGMLLVVDDARMRLLPGERIEAKKVRFRTLGRYPLTGAIESNAATVPEIIVELVHARRAEWRRRAIGANAPASMEENKQEGHR